MFQINPLLRGFAAALLFVKAALGQQDELVEEHLVVAAVGNIANVTLKQSPDPGFPVRCYVNGAARPSTAFQVYGQILAFDPAFVPSPGDSISVFYKSGLAASRGSGPRPNGVRLLVQTDLNAKKLHDEVAMVLAQTSPSRWGRPSGGFDDHADSGGSISKN